MSIKASKMVLAAGVSALALMMMASGAMAQEVGIEPTVSESPDMPGLETGGVDPIPAELLQTGGVDPIPVDLGGEEVVISPIDLPVDLGGEEVVLTPIDQPVDLGGEEVVITPIDQPVDLGGEEVVITPDVPVDVTSDAQPMMNEGDGIATVEPMLDGAAAEAQDVAMPRIVTAQARQAQAIPNFCDTKAGQGNSLICGSYHKK